MDARLPNFLIVGAMKSGTTSLWRYLKQHPQIYMPSLKEPRILASSIFINPGDELYRFHRVCKSCTVSTFEDYVKLFSDARNEKAIGEASPHYLYTHSTTIPVIKKYLGDVKIIIILRNPADRAFSAYKHTSIIDRTESMPFEKCLELEEERRKNEVMPMMHFYKDLGFYYNQVNAYMENFSRVKVVLLDDLENDAKRLVQDIYDFLDVDSSFTPGLDSRHNSSPPPNMFLGNFILNYNHPLKRFLRPVLLSTIGLNNTEKLLNLLKRGEQIKMNPETRRYLTELYKDDILKLQDLIKLDLSSWLKQ